VRLLLDEMLAAPIAEQLRRLGHDAIAVQEEHELMGLSDREQFRRAQQDERAVVTYNRDDFLELDREFRAADRRHAGIVIVNPRRFPQRRGHYGPLIRSLDAFARAGSPYPGFVHWLQ
jgi:hypothetical protein